MKRFSLPGVGYFLFPAVLGPVSVLGVDWFTTLATPQQLMDSLSLLVVGTFVVLLAVGIGAFSVVFGVFYRQCEERPVAAYRLLARLPFAIVLWSAVHNLAFSLVLHSTSSIITDSVGLWITGLYAGAVGTFFGIFFYAAMVPRMEARLPIGPALAGEAKPPRTDVRFMSSVVLTIASFLFGAVGI
ncbi:MAG TPA: hypothetical protein VJ932_04480, partial [Alkalispirochaeta sp.]|nr:hypothetical protein [Alkalispirochaeta sp.]